MIYAKFVYLAIAVAVYEYLLTIKHEYALWRRKWTVSTWLFLMNRYLMIIVAVVQFAPYRQHVSVFILPKGPRLTILAAVRDYFNDPVFSIDHRVSPDATRH